MMLVTLRASQENKEKSVPDSGSRIFTLSKAADNMDGKVTTFALQIINAVVYTAGITTYII